MSTQGEDGHTQKTGEPRSRTPIGVRNEVSVTIVIVRMILIPYTCHNVYNVGRARGEDLPSLSELDRQ